MDKNGIKYNIVKIYPNGVRVGNVPSIMVRAGEHVIIDRVNEQHGKLQVIVVDHAGLEEDSFKDFVCENWWTNDMNLVPSDWYRT